MSRCAAACRAVVVAMAWASSAAAQTAERPLFGSSITVDAFGVLPAPASLLSLLDTAVPDVISDRIDTGGLSAGQAARVGAHGSTWTQTLFTLGDIDITDPTGTGTPLLLPGVDTWERADVATGIMPLERSAPGLAIALTPRKPSSTRIHSAAFTGSVPGLNANGAGAEAVPIARLNSWIQGNVAFSGPIVDRKIGFFATVDATRSTHFERASPDIIDSNVASAFVNLTATPAGTDEVRTIGWLQRARDPVAGHAMLGRPNTGETRVGFHGQAVWSHELANRDGGLRVFGGLTTRQRTNTLKAPASVVVERISDGPVPDLLDAGPGLDRTWSVGARIHGGFIAGRSAQHVTRLSTIAGIEATGASTTAQSSFAGAVGELIDGIPARLWLFTDPAEPSRWRSTTAAAYGGATVALAPRLTINGGLRIESIRGARNDDAPVVSWRSVLPRAGAQWFITNIGQLATFAHYGRYGHRLPLRHLAYGDPTAPTATVWRWHAPPGTTTLDGASIGPFFQRLGPGTAGDPLFSAIDPALRQPFMHEVIVGIESRPHRSTFMRLAAIGRRERHLAGVVNSGVPASTYIPIGIPDAGVDVIGSQDDQTLMFFNRAPATFGADQYLLTNPPDDDTSFVGADLAIQARWSRWTLLAGITAGRSDGQSANRGFGPRENDAAVLGEVFINPNAKTNGKGRVFTERGYTIKIANMLQLGRDFDCGVVARYQDGQHFARLVIMEGLNQGAEAVRAFPNGKTRFTFSMTVDARLQKGFRIGGRRVSALVDAYNVFNQALQVEEFSVTGPTSRLTSAVQPPRVVQVGVRLPF